MAAFQLKDACAALTKCNKMLLHQPPLTEQAWEVIEPYVSCTAIEGKFLLGNEALIQMLLAVAADVQVELKHPEEAAFLYKEALKHEGSCGFADCYAMLVVKHQLSDHVSSALEAIERLDGQWRGKSMLYRWMLWILWFVFLVIPHPRIWREYREAKEYKEMLRRMSSAVVESRSESCADHAHADFRRRADV